MAVEMAAMPAVAVFFGGMLHVSITDLKQRRIYNGTILALLAAYPVVGLVAGLPMSVMLISAAAATVIFALGFACFCAGWLGGGDVKLAAVAVLWLGADLLPAYLLLATVFGALLALLFIALARAKNSEERPLRAEMALMPFGPALASAAVVLFGDSQWFTAL